jgi:hypothetical protein
MKWTEVPSCDSWIKQSWKITQRFGFPILENLWSNFIDHRPFPQRGLPWRNFKSHKFWKTTHGSGFHTLKKLHWKRARAWNHLIAWIPGLEKSDWTRARAWNHLIGWSRGVEKSDWLIFQPRKPWIKFYVILDLWPCHKQTNLFSFFHITLPLVEGISQNNLIFIKIIFNI